MPETRTVEITHSNRGFQRYDKPLETSDSTAISVYESSSAEAPHVWVNIAGTAWCHPGPGKPLVGTNLRLHADAHISAHLNEQDARGLIARLQAWVDEIPQRWGDHITELDTATGDAE